jgi:Zn-dependent protease with chaperone function
MTHITGRYHDGNCSQTHLAELQVDADEIRVLAAGGALRDTTARDAITIDERLGNMPRFIRFADGARFESSDNDVIDAAFGVQSRVHRYEGRWSLVLGGVFALIVLVSAAVKWGIPWAADKAAQAMPDAVLQQADASTLQIFEQQLKISRVPALRQAQILARCAPLIQAVAAKSRIQVQFRDGAGSFGANAFALPAGTIVVTDQLVNKAVHDDEIVAVIAHEIGHVVYRHGMRNAFQASLISLLPTLLIGDVSSVSTVVATLPVILTKLGYSREAEREADMYAVQALTAMHIPAHRLGDLLKRIDKGGDLPGYLSTHPPTPERTAAAQAQ